MAAELGIDKPASGSAWLKALAGNELLPGMQPYAMAYGGHQFGHWAGQLGDGRAIALGEMLGESGKSWELQLKGAGPTPYSRTADGRAVLRSSLREFICSEAMHHLGVPTTRALSLVTTGDLVVRDMFYDGRPAAEPGAIVCRVAPSFIRFGNFQLPASRGDVQLLTQLVEYTIREHFPELDAKDPQSVLQWFTVVCERTAKMVVDWQCYGFVHGVMNTDNMSIHGLTIDYGPYGWLEPFDPGWTPNTTDAQGRRYSFGNQPGIAHWNLAQLGSALMLLGQDAELMQAALDSYRTVFDALYEQRFAAKLGIKDAKQAAPLLESLFSWIQQTETDYCLLFRNLAAALECDDPLEALAPAFYKPEEVTAELRGTITSWLNDWRAADDRPVADRQKEMNAANPLYVPRNYLAQQAIEAAERGDNSELETLLAVLKRPFEEQPGMERYAQRRPEWARDKAGCSALSCSS